MKKRSLSLLLALVMVFSLLPVFELSAAAASYTLEEGNSISVKPGDTITLIGSNDNNRNHTWSSSNSAVVSIASDSTGTDNTNVATAHSVTQATTVTISHWRGSGIREFKFTITVTPETAPPTPTPSTTPDDPINPGDIVDGNFVYSPAQTGLHVGDDIDLSQTYYVKVDGQWKEVTISKDTYYTAVANDGDTHNDRVVKTQKSDGYYGEASAVTGWTPITGDGMYYMKDAESAAVHNNFVLVQAENGTLTHDAYSNKLIAAKSGSTSDGMIVGPSESIGGWTTGESDVIVVDAAGNEHKVLYANKGSTFHYNMFIYYMDGNDVVYLTQGANESDGDSKYFSSYPGSPKSDTPTGVGKYYYTYNNTLGNYGGKGYYTGTYYRERSHQGKVALYIVDNGQTRYLGRDGIDHRTNAIHDHMVVYTGPLYQLQTLQRATYFSYEGGTPVESRLGGDELTSLTLYTRRMSGESEITQDDPDNGTGANQMGVLVDTTNNFKGNLFIQKSLYRANDGTYNIKLESWATGNMSQSGGGEPTDIVLVVDLSNSMWQSDTKDLTDTDGSAMYRSTAVIRAISSFIDTLHEADPNGENYRLSIVSFSGEPNKDGYGGWVFLFDGANHYYKTTEINSHANASLKPVDNAGVTALKQSINTTEFKEPKGDNTYPANGLDVAKIVLNKRTTHTDRPATVIMFTDGVPGTGTGRGYSKYADPAIESAYDLKHNYNATIYTVGLFNFNDENLMGHSRASASEYMGTIIDPGTYSVKEYMEAVSSKYPNAQTEVIPGYATPSGEQPARRPCNLTPENTDQQYYFKVDTSHGSVGIQTLLDAFGTIASTIAVTDVPVTTSSILRDVINTEDFALPKYIEGTTVKASTVPASEINSRKQIAWDYAHEAPATDLTISVDRLTNMDGGFLKSVDVKGYDYQANFSAPAAGTASAKLGNKLVVRIYGLKPKHGGEVYSNSEAGILNKPEGSSSFEMYLPVESPFDDIATRPYVVDFNAKMNLATNATLVDEDYSGTTKFANTYMTNSILGTNGNFANTSGTVSYQLIAKDQVNGSTNFKNYSFTGSDTALVFGQYYANDTRADGTKTPGDITTKQIVEGEKVDQTVAKAWQVVNMIPASSIYYDDDLTGTTATVGDGSGYNAAVTVSPAQTAETTKKTLTFTGTGIDIYCTTDKTGGYAQAKLDGDKEQTQTMRNYSETPRYNVPTFSFRGLEYGMHVVEINILSNSNYRFDGVRVYGPVENQKEYDGTTEKNAAYINMREALVNDNNVTAAFSDQMEEAVLGALFVDDASKLELQQQASYWDPNVVNEDGSKGAYVGDTDKDGNPVMVDVYKDKFDAYKANSPKHEIYLNNNQAIIFQLTEEAETAAASGNLWIGLSAPDAKQAGGDNSGTVTLKEGQTINVTSSVDMYYPITASMIGANRVVTLTNTGSTMISVTNLKITGNEDIYNAAADQKVGVSDDGAGALSVEDAVSLVFEPMTMRSIKIAANNGVDPDAVVTDDPGNTDDPVVPDTPSEPDTPDEPDDPKPGWDDNAYNPVNLLKTLFKLLLQSLGGLFSGLGGW